MEIITLKSASNLGLSEDLKKSFSNSKILSKPELKFKNIPDPFWISGFVSGEGSFNFVVNKSKSASKVRFSINLHLRDYNVLKSISFYLKINKYNPYPSYPPLGGLGEYSILKYIHNREKSV